MKEPQTNPDIALPSINALIFGKQTFPITHYFDLMPPMMQSHKLRLINAGAISGFA